MLKLYKICLIYCIANNILSSSSAGEEDGELLAVSLLYRHGERTPKEFYPNDPYKNASFWPVAAGELTNDGKRRHYNLGKWLRERYNGFLSTNYSPSEIYVRSGDINRCLESAASDLSGMYPPVGDQIWNPDISWLPIPIHTVAAETDGVIELKKPCAKFDRLSKKLKQSGFYKKLNDDNKVLYDYLTRNSGKKFKNFKQASRLHDTLYIETLFNYSLPQWANIVYPEPLRTLAKYKFIFPTSTPEIAKFGVGQLFDKIIQQFDSFVPKSKLPRQQKFMVYSSHDTNIFNVLNALGTKNVDLVPYAATVIFELRNSTNVGNYVRMLYKTDEVSVLSINGCEDNCVYDDFLKKLKHLTISDDKWNEACEVSAFDVITDSIRDIFF